MNDNTFTPTEPGVYVDRVYQAGRDAPPSVNTVRVGNSIDEFIAENWGRDETEVRRNYYEAHSERLMVVR